MQQWIGCDAHKKFSVFVAVDERGKAGHAVRVEHKREVFRTYLESLPAQSEIAIESMGSWYWLVDEMERAQHIPHQSPGSEEAHGEAEQDGQTGCARAWGPAAQRDAAGVLDTAG